MKRLLMLIFVLPTFAFAKEKLHFPYFVADACLSKCAAIGLTYQLDGATKAYNKPDEKSVVFLIKAKEEVKLLQLAEVVTKPGKFKIHKKYDDGECQFPAGALLYQLTYHGEGYSDYWYKGRFAECHIEADDSKSSVEMLSESQYLIWAKVQNKAGKVGWILDSPATSSLFDSQY